MNNLNEESDTNSFTGASTALFRIGPQWGYGMAQDKDNLDAWELYSEGYRRAADQLYAAWDPKGTGARLLLFPLAYLYRHHIELLVKELLLLSTKFLQLPPDWKWRHDDIRFWKLLRPMIDKLRAIHLSGFSVNQLDSIERLLTELSERDPNTQLFRYPIQRNSSCHLQQLDSLDLKNFCSLMQQLSAPLSNLCGLMKAVL